MVWLYNSPRRNDPYALLTLHSSLCADHTLDLHSSSGKGYQGRAPIQDDTQRYSCWQHTDTLQADIRVVTYRTAA